MNNIDIIRDSIKTSLALKLFQTKEESCYAHIFRSKLISFPLSTCRNLENFNPERLQKSAIMAYPLDNRPRGIDDIKSVHFYQKKIQEKKDISPIWLIQNKNQYVLLDGAHRIVANYIEKKKNISAYVIDI
jgi:hypothetical protein